MYGGFLDVYVVYVLGLWSLGLGREDFGVGFRAWAFRRLGFRVSGFMAARLI